MSLRVVMVGDYPDPGCSATGGIAAALEAVVPELSKRVDLTVLVPGSNRDQVVRDGSTTLRYLKRAPGPGILRYWTADAWRIRQAIAALAPDLVHVQGAAGSALWLDSPVAVTVHGIPHLNARASRRSSLSGRVTGAGRAALTAIIEREARRRVGNVVIINDYVLEALPDIAGLHTVRISNPVHMDFLDMPRQGKPGISRTLVAVGRVQEAKGVGEAISLIRALKHYIPSVKLRWCGPQSDSRYWQSCTAMIREFGLAEAIAFPGAMSRRQLISEFDRADGLLVVSRQETAPMVVGEAMVRGTPVFGRRQFGLRTMITPDVNGAFLSDDTPSEQADALARALEYPWDREGIGRAAAAEYSPRVVAARLAEFYAEIVSRKVAGFQS